MMEKLSKTAKRLDTLFKILFWFLVAAAGIIILFSLLKIVLTPEDMSKYAVSEQLILGNIMLTVSEEAMPIIGEMWWIYVLPYLTVVISGVVIIWGIRIVRSILKPMISASPFIGSVSVDLKRLGWLTLFGGAAVTVCNVIRDMLFYNLFFCDDVISSILKDTVTGVSIMQTYDVTFIIITVILFLASYAFQYGEELQQQADETL